MEKFSGRLPNALANIDAAILNAKEYNAEGILLTSWGDCGNHQPWVTLYPPLLYGAAQSWNDDKICESSLITGLNKHVFQKQNSSLSKLLIELGKLDQLIGSDIANTSLCWSLLFAPLPNKLIEHLRENHRISQLDIGLSHLQKLNELVYSQEQNDKNFLLAQEISLGIELSTVALQKGICLLSDKVWRPLSQENSLFSNYKSLWLKRARSGGLDESMQILTKALTKS